MVHYLDDFLMLGQSDSFSCSCSMKIMSTVCEEASLPIEPAKTVDLVTKITEWEYCFAETWNGISMLSSLNNNPLSLFLTHPDRGDAWYRMVSTSLEVLSRALQHFCQLIVIAAAVWGKNWFGQLLLVQSENLATVMNSGVSHNSEAMHLLRYLSSSSYR